MTSTSDIAWPAPDTILRHEGTFQEAKKSLLLEDTDNFIALIVGSVEVDYKPVEKTLGLLTNLIHDRFVKPDGPKEQQTVSVIPRGSFATRTAIKGHVDLDVDVIFYDSYPMTTGGQVSTLKRTLGTDATGEDILFDKKGLRDVLQAFWNALSAPRTSTTPSIAQLPPLGWLKILKTGDDITRSLSLQTTKTTVDGMALPEIPVDIFIKVRTKVRGQDVIIGIDKDSPMGNRRYQTTTFIPSEGMWLGDNVLSPVDRIALLTLKWWKNDLHDDTKTRFPVKMTGLTSSSSTPLSFPASKVEIKSHHLLAALNALHELDIRDDLYVPTQVSQPFTLRQVKQVMMKVLEYLNRAYNPFSKSLFWTTDGDLDYIFPQYSYQTMERVFMEARGDWNKYMYLLESNVIPSFRDEIGKSIKST